MLEYYSGTITIGILLIIVSIVLIMLDKKNAVDYAAKVEEEKNELIKVLEESEEMLDELNKFSDYVINQVDKRSIKLSEMLNTFDGKVIAAESQTKHINNEPKVTQFADTEVKIKDKAEEPKKIYNDHLNNKHKEVLEMVEKGMSDMEIAKALNMGKGEVQLILGVNINKLRIIK